LGGIEEEENILNNNTIKYNVTRHVSETQLQGGPKQRSTKT